MTEGADAIYAAPAQRGDALATLAGPRLKGSGEEAELRAIVDSIEAYEGPEGKKLGDKGLG
jgi:hypothetical protein